jgi:hypothetical protein
MIGANYANRTIPKPVKGVQLIKESYQLNDIADLCISAFREDVKYMKEFAKAFPPTMQGVKQLFDFCDRHFQYKEDPDVHNGSVQAVQSPMWLWHKSKTGDCKSYTVFQATTLVNMGVTCKMRLVDYGISEKHIYPVAVIDGREIPCDVVYKKQLGGQFGTEKKYKMKIKDVVHKAGLYKVGDSGQPEITEYQANQIWESVVQMKMAVSDISDDIITQGGVDVTTLTNGELDQFIAAEKFRVYADHESDNNLRNAYERAAVAVGQRSIAGLGSIATTEFGRRVSTFIKRTNNDTRPAFENFNLAIPIPKVDGDKVVNVSGIGFIKVKNFFKKIGNAVASVFKKVANFIFKGAGKKMGPYFLLQFLSPAFRLSPKLKKKREAQRQQFKHIAKKGKFDDSKLMSLASIGIKEATGLSPQQILNGSFNKKVSGIGVAPLALAAIPAASVFAGKVMKAIGFVLEVIKKIGSLFKKDKSNIPPVSQENASDLAELQAYAEELERQKEAAATTGEGAGLAAAAALGVGLIFFLG